jgi:CheY-like chemotaxis protein
LARKILLADDSVTAQNMGRKILADAGYEVITVNNGSAALKKIAEQKPDLIVLDVYMPGYSGLEVCQRLKEAQETARVPVLLTVGKLEPFKPEEAKRVRADGFIVKPFEASELLSALSKLEDKIVPRAEASKPGRFARVTAAIEEGRYDKTVAITEDVGWKNRISFPSKKERSAPEDGESAAIYKPVEKPRPTEVEEAKVDLGALAPEGLPKDVTPEEIAALAAAAAQMKGKTAESSIESTENSALAAPIAEQKSEVRSETGFEEKLAEKFEEKSGTPQKKSSEAAADADVAATASHSNLMAATVGLDPAAAALPGTDSGSGFSSPDGPPQPANEPVTMALAAEANSVTDAPRWTVVSVSLGKEEAAISLEHEMQKAYAAFAAAVNGHMSSASPVPETGSDSALPVAPTDSSSVPQAGKPEPVTAIPALPAPEAVQTLSSPLGNASTEAIRAAVQELEMVAESFVGETAAAAGFGSAPVVEGASSPVVEAIAKDSPGSTAAESQPEGAKPDSTKSELTKLDDRPSWRPEPTNQEWNKHSWKSEGQTYAEQKNDPWKKEVPLLAGASEGPEKKYEPTPDKDEITAPALANAVPAEQTPVIQPSSSVSVETAATAEGGGEMAKKESEAASTTAAAWASWRQIRESGDSKAASDEHVQKAVEQTSNPQDAAAMAVAAGAEKTPEPADSQSDPAAIASIVDSVLADLRPKIFEEISRKMGKK